ncbi:hypothetical protein MMC08_003253 [Hypocenomyce scalaris]|nr:hypothetical protein [Hypocenomyce scalaris]
MAEIASPETTYIAYSAVPGSPGHVDADGGLAITDPASPYAEISLDVPTTNDSPSPPLAANANINVNNGHGPDHGHGHGPEDGIEVDNEEMDREDMKHHMSMLLMNGRLHLAPIGSNPQKILDVGTGTGIWAIEMGETYPTTEVIGTDLSPIQPTWIPPNVKFEIDDVEEEWLYHPNSFDFIHFRFLFLAIKNLPRALDQSMGALKPGGWIELCELDIFPVSIDGSPPESYSHISAFLDTVHQAALRQGCDVKIAPKYKDLVIRAGYEEVTEEIMTVPWGSWPRDLRLKEAGAFLRAELRGGLQGISMGLFTRCLGWTAKEVEVFLIGVRKDLDNNQLHLCSKL